MPCHDIVEEIKAEVDKICNAEFVQEVKYPKWLANIEYKNMNHAYPKDDLHLIGLIITNEFIRNYLILSKEF